MVGDISQSIYGFRGSRPDVLEKFVKNENATQFTLTRQYRASKSILLITNFVRQFTGSNSVSLKTGERKRKGNMPVLTECTDVDSDAEKIKGYLTQQRMGKVLLLARTNALVERFKQLLADELDIKNIMTIHAAKGLECDSCIVIDPRFSAKRNIKFAMDTKVEADRLLYTALSRPSKNLLIVKSASTNHFYIDGNDEDDINLLDQIAAVPSLYKRLE
jgi:superfamily I DNA/RNA helicase